MCDSPASTRTIVTVRSGLRFADDALIRDAVCHRLEVAIDAVAKVNQDLLADVPDWPKIVGIRNMLAHQYADLDQEILQNTIDNRLDGFVRLVERLHRTAATAER